MTAKAAPALTTRISRWIKGPKGQQLTHTAPALVVFGVAAYQSYWHTVEVVTRAGEGGHGVAHIMALGVDGMMVVAARYITHSATRVGKLVSVASFVVGILATLGMNYLAADPNPLSRVVAVLPAIAMVGTACMLHWGGKKAPKRATQPRNRAVGTPTNTRVLKAV